MTHKYTHTQYNSSVQVISSSQKRLPKQHTTQETNIHALSGIQIRDSSAYTARARDWPSHLHRLTQYELL
jgi:hypothetical protein